MEDIRYPKQTLTIDLS